MTVVRHERLTDLVLRVTVILEQANHQFRLLGTCGHVAFRPDKVDARQGIGVFKAVVDKVDRCGFVNTDGERINAAFLVQNVEMRRRLTCIKVPAVDIARGNAVSTEVFRVKEQHHGKVSARRGAADGDALEVDDLASLGHDVGDCLCAVLDEFGELCVRVHAVVQRRTRNAALCKIVEYRAFTPLVSVFNAAAVDVDEQIVTVVARFAGENQIVKTGFSDVGVVGDVVKNGHDVVLSYMKMRN